MNIPHTDKHLPAGWTVAEHEYHRSLLIGGVVVATQSTDMAMRYANVGVTILAKTYEDTIKRTLIEAQDARRRAFHAECEVLDAECRVARAEAQAKADAAVDAWMKGAE